MTRDDYIKYHTTAKDMLGETLKPGDTVVVNNNYTNTPFVGTLDHFTKSGRCAVKRVYSTYGGKDWYCWCYRKPSIVVKIKSKENEEDLG